MRIKLQTEEDSFPFDVDQSDTILDIKRKIEANRNIPSNGQLLLAKVPDGASVSSLKLQEGHVLFFLPFPIEDVSQTMTIETPEVPLNGTKITTIEATTTTITSPAHTIVQEPDSLTPSTTPPVTTSPPPTPGSQRRPSWIKRHLSRTIKETTEQEVVKQSLKVVESVTPQIVAEAAKTVPDILKLNGKELLGAFRDSSAALSIALLASFRRITLTDKTSKSEAHFFNANAFFQKLREDEDLRKAKISELYRMQVPGGVMHEYVMLKTLGPKEGDAPQWIRVDRNLNRLTSPMLSKLFLVFNSLDYVSMSSDKNHQLMAGKNTVKCLVQFNDKTSQPSVLDFGVLLRIMENKSQDYKFLSENCWFFTSVIQEVLCSNFKSVTAEGSIGREKLGPNVREKVKNQFKKEERTLERLKALNPDDGQDDMSA